MQRSPNKQPHAPRAVALNPNPEIRQFEEFPEAARRRAREIADVIRESDAPRRGGLCPRVHPLWCFGVPGQ
eukprot:14448271-Alexandrium_andersonii.AAC.1